MKNIQLKDTITHIYSSAIKEVALDVRDKILVDLLYDQLLKKLAQKNPEAIDADIEDLIHRFMFSIYLKVAKRYLKNSNGDIFPDIYSTKWTLEYFRIEPVLSQLKTFIQGKTVLDPMAGSGNDMHLVAAICKPQSIVCHDICYVGGRTVPGTDFHYAPEKNQEEIEGKYGGLPEEYKPHLKTKMTGYTYNDAKNLPYENDSFDWVVTHPPFGINYRPGGAMYLQPLLAEMLKVVKEGVIFSAPINWKEELVDYKERLFDLTGDVTNGKSKYPSCFLLLKK